MRKSNQHRQRTRSKGLRIVAGAAGILLATQSISFAGIKQQKEVKEDKRTSQTFLLAQSEPNVLVPNPEILIDGKPNHTTNPRPQFLPRAVAPPVGDIAISTINASPVNLNLSTHAVVPRLVLREAPVREVLGLLARAAGLNLVFTTEGGDAQATQQQAEQTISLDLENEPVEDVFNSVLLVSGLTANRRGNTIYVGARLPDSARDLVTRTLRVNQVSASSASAFLASQGAQVERLITPVREIVDPVTNRIVQRVTEPAQLQTLTITNDEDSIAPLLLNGLKVSTDDRLNLVTLVGSPRQVEIASSFITQLDARQRQVAVNVKVVDINLNNRDFYNSSFSFGIGDTVFNQNQGEGIVNFGTGLPTQRFVATIQSEVTNGNAKILTDPTLVIQEGQEATVKLAQNIVTNFSSEVAPDTGVVTTEAEIEEVGLILQINVERIDDNGYISLSVAPTVSSPGADFQLSTSGFGAPNTINLITKRELSSGLVRLRDSQTLVLSGIIQEIERNTISKVPIFGDLPILGALFRRTDRQNERAEVVVLVTPQILDDSDRSNFGYQYTPGRDVRRMLQKRGFPVQGYQ
ncbi:MAG: secretin N-terminal domain-containing protein [Prochloraceae cyanobacterium]